MEKIANVKDLKRGEYINFDYQGNKAILVKTPNNKIVAYNAVCPHEGGTIIWDANINKLLCECHLSIFNVDDGSVYKFSSIFDKINNLTPIKLEIDKKKDIYVI